MKIKALSVLMTLAATALTASANIQAAMWTVHPFEVVLSESGNGARQAYQITNNANRPLSIVASVWDREVDAEGNDIRTEPAEDDFIIIPAQVVIPPGSKRTVRVQYVGDPVPYEQAYRLMFEEATGVKGDETAVDDGKVRTQMNISMRYNSRLFVRPQKAATNLPLVKDWSMQDNTLDVSLFNDGDTHVFLGEYAIALVGQDTEKPVYFSLKEETGILLARGSRNYRLPMPGNVQEVTNVGVVKVAR